jgi:hypothetical protein
VPSLDDLRRRVKGDGPTMAEMHRMAQEYFDAFPEVSVARGGIKYPAPSTETTYTNPVAPEKTGAAPEVGDIWVDTENGGRVQVWNGSDWTQVVDPAGRGGFWGDGRTGFEAETAEDRWKREAERADGDAIRLGPHWARKDGSGGWECEACGGCSADAGVLAETDCG